MNLPEITVRAAVAADTAAMSKLAYRSKKSNGYDDQVMEFFKEGLNITPDRLTRRPFWVAEVEKQIVGCIALDPLNKVTAEVRTFFTDPEHRARGVGYELWQALLTVAQAQGITRLLAHADPASIRYYQNLGFIQQGEVQSRNIPGALVPYMVREI